jgi:hypothetical protein
MLITQGIYNGENIELSEIISFKQKKKVPVTFPENKTEETKTPAQILLDLFGSWEDDRDAQEIISQIKQARKNSAQSRKFFNVSA